MFRGKLDRFLERVGAHDLQHRPEDFLVVGLHAGLHIVEQRWADEEAILVPLQLEAATVDDQLRALVDAGLDVACDLVAMGLVDHRPVLRSRIAGDTNLHRLDFSDHALTQFVSSLLADRHDDRERHAAFARRAEGGASEVLHDLVHVGVRHDDAVVLRPTHRLHALTVGCAGVINVVGDVGGANEAHRFDRRVMQDRIDGDLVAMHHVEYARHIETGGGACFHEQLTKANRHGRITLGRLEHKRVAHRDRYAKHPHRDHGGEVERRDAGDDAERLAHRVNIDARASAFRVFALEGVRDAAGELDDFQAALDVALRVSHHLSMLAGKQFGQRLHVGFDEALELEHHASAALRVRAGPARQGLCCRLYGCIDVLGRGEADPGLDLARIGVEDIPFAARGRLDRFSADESFDTPHARNSQHVCLYRGFDNPIRLTVPAVTATCRP